MKKVFAIIAVASIMASCNNETETKTTMTTEDSLKMADSIKAAEAAKMAPVTPTAPDTSKMTGDSSSKMKMSADTSKK